MYPTLTNLSFVKFAKTPSGSLPESELLSAENEISFVRFRIEFGRLPFSRLSDRKTDSSVIAYPILEGIVPLRLLKDRCTTLMFGKLKRLLGIEDEKRLLFRERFSREAFL